MVSPAFAALPAAVQSTLTAGVTRKFNAYFAFTPSTACTRATMMGAPAGGNPIYMYSDESMISDLTVLWSLFCEVFELINEKHVDVNTTLAMDQRLVDEFRRMFNEGGEFWDSPHGPRSLRRVTNVDALADLRRVWRTLRNGYAHFHWRYENLSAVDCWTAQGWDVANPQAVFNIGARPPSNYMAYIADARPPWDAGAFWDQNDLRIFVVPYTTFRYSLHLFLNISLNDSVADVFSH
jgi:hypothetical protein